MHAVVRKHSLSLIHYNHIIHIIMACFDTSTLCNGRDATEVELRKCWLIPVERKDFINFSGRLGK